MLSHKKYSVEERPFFNTSIDHFDLRQYVLSLHILHVCIYVVTKKENERFILMEMKNDILHA
jgi:hypothetical protein